jgi:Leucine-rich repeat (LRR) protein
MICLAIEPPLLEAVAMDHSSWPRPVEIPHTIPIDSLENDWIETELQTLEVYGTGSCDLGALAGMKKLAALEIGFIEPINLSPLSELKDLINLRIASREIEDLWNPRPESVLARVELSAEKIGDLSQLTALQQLESISLDCSGVLDDLTPLGRIQKLASLELSTCPSDIDLSFLSESARLRVLSVSLRGNSDRSWESLGELKQLEYLTIDQTAWTESTAALEGLTGLVGLDLTGCPELKDLKPLGKLSDLQYVCLTGCQEIRNFTPLGEIRNLRGLSLEGTSVRDLAFVKRLPKLRYLNIGNCPNLNDFSPLKGFLARGGFLDTGMNEQLEERLKSEGLKE